MSAKCCQTSVLPDSDSSDPQILDFKPLTLEDIGIVGEFMKKNPSRLCDNTIGTVAMWRDFFHTRYAIKDDVLYLSYKLSGERVTFAMPFCDEPFEVLGEIFTYCEAKGLPPIITTVTEEELAVMRQHCAIVQAKGDESWRDYLYNSEDLLNLSGKKYATQRNHISRFKREYPNHRFEVLGPENLPAVTAFMENFDISRHGDEPEALEERDKTLEVLRNYGTYGMEGGALFVEDKVVAFSIGEVVGDTLYVHIEKGDTDYMGVYQMMTHEFNKQFTRPDTRFNNREEDMGNEGLRKAKLAYHPVKLLPKYTVELAME